MTISKVYNLDNFSVVRNAQITFSGKPQMKKNRLNKHKDEYLSQGYRCKSSLAIFTWRVT